MKDESVQPIEDIEPIEPETLIQKLRQDRAILNGFCVAFEGSIPFTCQVMESVSMDLEEAGLYLREMMARENPSKGEAPHAR